MTELETPRIVCQFSCGAASAVATKLAIAEYASTHDVVAWLDNVPKYEP